MSLTALRIYQLGRLQRLPILRLVSIGAYLDGGVQDILLPLRYLPEGAQEGQELEVFVYHDNEGRLIATTLQPLAEVGQAAYLRCSSVTEAGAFLEWGIHKDLFVPFREQATKMQVGYSYVVYLYVDQLSGKIVGSARLAKHLDNIPATYVPGQAVQILVAEQHERGYRAIVEHQHWGMLYADDTPRMLRRGEVLTAYVIRLREDNRLDLSLTPIGYEKIDATSQRLLELLRSSGGVLPIGDKSSPEEIYRLTKLSKKTFKMSLGALYKARLVTLQPEEVRLS